MNSYHIYTHQDGKSEAVKQGWSWPAFFFGMFWACAKQLWKLAAGLLVLGLVFIFAPFVLDMSYDGVKAFNLLCNILGLGIGLWLGGQGNAMREKNLQERGFRLVSNVEAQSPELALTEHRTEAGADAAEKSPAASMQA
ncbi:DUF2628 domain-containing protein [Marinobacter bohaiensis]|uniref:DUF2628 domain-containing protein n=1 Tax=Marinobacter bohaiensis TaxID=2201898 RepID=UPI000DABF968|nr:DUF2628 domain-containing protein [Marinobacter bohaiensis]